MKATDIDRMIEKHRLLTTIITASELGTAPKVLEKLKTSPALGCSFRWLEEGRTLKVVLSADAIAPIEEAGRSLRAIAQEHRWNIAFFQDTPEAPEFRVAVMDMDSTIIDQEVIEELADFAGYREQVTAITTAAMEGKLDFREALRERVALLKGQPASILREVLESRITATPGLKDMIDGLHRRGITTAVISGGFLPIVQGFTEPYGIRHCMANSLGVDGDYLDGTVAGEIVDATYKLRYLEQLCADHRCDLSAAIAIGDGANDLPMIKAAGLGVAFCAKPIVQEEAGAIVRNRRIDEVLHFLA